MVMVQRQVEKALENMNFSVVEHNSVENEKEEEIEQYDSIPGDDEVDEEPISELPVSSQALISISDESTFQRPVLNNVSFASSFEKFDSETTNTDKRSISEASQLEQDQFAPETPIVEIRNGEMDRRAFPTFQLPKITESQSLPMMQESSSESQRMYQRLSEVTSQHLEELSKICVRAQIDKNEMEKNLKAQLLKAEMENLQLREKISRRTNESIAGIDSVLESGIYGVTMQQLLDTFSNLKSSLLEIEHVLRPAQETNQSASKPPVFALPPMVEYAPVPTGYAPNFPGPSGQYQSFPAPNQYNDPNLMGFQARRPVDDQRWRPAFSNFAQPPRQNHGRRYGFERPRETRKMAQNDFAVLSDMTNGREPCAICLGEMDSNRQNLFRCRQCTKMIHDKCMSQWRQRNNTCVYCRAILL
ncbi:unnamed protein product [Caenorhabditis auriculariae]|uniref:RING-type domain-containing protein n=1 Tax=Caenorhabditis auriculariae TaxID=2777116 RepID=A0A8S1H156_9PELO|nr:unnamed protein product [Caenorhabditis auriculariae]